MMSAASRSCARPEDAFRCFMGMEMETLVASNCILRKDEQDPSVKQNYEGSFEPD